MTRPKQTCGNCGHRHGMKCYHGPPTVVGQGFPRQAPSALAGMAPRVEIVFPPTSVRPKVNSVDRACSFWRERTDEDEAAEGVGG